MGIEHQLPTLAGNPNPANLDAKLTSALFAELGIEFALRYYSFADFLVLPELEPEHRSKLDRYIV